MIRAHVTLTKIFVSWLVLLALTLLSFGTSRLGLGESELFIALGIAVAKTMIVLMIFMHLAEQRFANRLVVILTFLFILLLVVLTAADPATRKTFPPRPDPAAPLIG